MDPLIVPGTLDALEEIRKYISQAADLVEMDSKPAYRLRLAVDEIATNIVTHGYEEAGIQGNIEVRGLIDEDSIKILIEDTGRAVDPNTIRPPKSLDHPLDKPESGGLGLFIAFRSVDELFYERLNDRNRHTLIVNRNKPSNGKTVEFNSTLKEGPLTFVPTFEENGTLPIFNQLISLTELSDLDVEQLRNSSALTRQWAKEIVSEFYGKLSLYKPLTSILKGDVRHNLRRVFKEWYLEVVRGDYNDGFWQQQYNIGGVHASKGVDNAIMIGLMSRVQLIFKKKCLKEFPPDLAEQVNAAFKRITDVITGLIAEGYHQTYSEGKRIAGDLQNIILPLGIALSAEKNLDLLLERILMETKSICNADGGTLYLRTDDNRLEFKFMHTDSLNFAMGGTTGKSISFPPLRLFDEITGEPNINNVATYVVHQGASISISDVYHTEDFDFTGAKDFDRKSGYRTKSLLTVPLKNHNDKVIGVLQLVNAVDTDTGKVGPFASYPRLVVESLASQAAIALNNHILLRGQQKLIRFEHDMKIGRRIQLDILPDMTNIKKPDGWEMAAYFRPAREVAGDFYDVITLAPNLIGFVIGDVCDKGLGAALFMSLSRSLIRAYAELHYSLGRGERSVHKQSQAVPNQENRQGSDSSSAEVNPLFAVQLANNYITRNHLEMDMFFTMVFGVLNTDTGSFNYINAGHNAPAVFNSDGVLKTRIKPSGPAVGISPDAEFEIKQITIDPGDLLLIFTDGVPDARDAQLKFFTERRLFKLLQRPLLSADEALDAITGSLRDHIGHGQQYDDITMLVVRRK